MELTLRTAARLEGTVRLVDTNDPVAGVLVRAFHGPDRLWRDVRSDDEGRFRFDGLEPGEGAYLSLGGPVARTRYTPTVLTAGETTSVVIEVAPGKVATGRVLDSSTGLPIPGAEVSAGHFLYAIVSADRMGRFRMPGLDDRSRVIHARADGFAAGAARFEDEETPVDIVLDPELVLTGRIVDGAGAPITSARIGTVQSIALGENGSQPLFRSPVGVDDEGVFRRRGIGPDQPLVISVRAPGFARRSWRIDDPRTVARDGVADFGAIELKPSLSLTGSLTWSTGEPVAGARVVARVEGDVEAGLSESFTHSSDDGTFQLRELASGPWNVSVTVDRVTRHRARVALHGPQRVDWTIGAGGEVAGVVTDEALEPIFKASVRLVPTDGTEGETVTRATGADGRFEIRNVVAGTYRLEVELGGFGRRGQEHLPDFEEWRSEPFEPDGRWIDVVLREPHSDGPPGD